MTTKISSDQVVMEVIGVSLSDFANNTVTTEELEAEALVLAQKIENLTPSDVGAEPKLTLATQEEMEAGTETDVRSMSPLLIRKAMGSVKAKSYFMGQI